jgi:predicted GIY-YIG superfamily endonuclease
MTTLAETDIAGRVVCHNIPEASGVYIVTDTNGSVLYVGSSNSLRRRIAYLEAHVADSASGGFTHDASDPLLQFQASGNEAVVHYILCDDYKRRERQLKEKYQPPWNKR